MQAKVKLETLGLGGLHWDAEIPEAMKKNWWEEWLAHLPSLNRVGISRCLSPGYNSSSYGTAASYENALQAQQHRYAQRHTNLFWYLWIKSNLLSLVGRKT